MTNIRKAAGAADLLRLVPALLGFVPQDSLVVLPMGGGRTLGAIRVDLPTDGEATVTAAATVGGMLPQVTGIDGAIFAQFGLRNDALHDWLATSMDTLGLRVYESLYVTTLGWGSFVSDETGTLEEITPEQVPGSPVRETAGMEPLPDCPPELVGLEPSTDSDDVTAVFDGLEVYITTGQLHRVATAAFMTILARPALRDVFLVQVARGEHAGHRAMDAQLAWEDGADYPEELAKTLWGDGPKPDGARLKNALALVRHVLSVRPEAGAYAVAAWLSWAMGGSTPANDYVHAGLALDPEHGLCEIVQSFIRAGHLPSWAFIR